VEIQNLLLLAMAWKGVAIVITQKEWPPIFITMGGMPLPGIVVGAVVL
jgi:hypothetical protein